MASSQGSLNVYVRAFANTEALNDYNWPLFASLTNSAAATLSSIFYSSNTGYNSITNTEPAVGHDASYTNVLSGYHNTNGNDYAQIVSVTSTQIVVKIYKSSYLDLTTVYRIGFRFYTQRLNPSGCNNVSVYTARYSWPYGASTGSWSVSCGVGGYMFYAIFSGYYPASPLDQWPSWIGGDTYQLTFNFNSISEDATNNANFLFVTASIVYESSAYYAESGCGCCYAPCVNYCCNSDYTCCCSYCDSATCCCSDACCNYPCATYCSCRHIQGWDYFIVTGTQNAAWNQPSSAIASAANIYLVSNQYSV